MMCRMWYNFYIKARIGALMFMKIVSYAADVLGIISFFISIFTYITTLNIKKKMVAHVEKTDYLNDIDNQVKNLNSYYHTIVDDDVYNSTLLSKIDADLDDLQVLYSLILPKDLLSCIKKLRKNIENDYHGNLNSTKAKRTCARQLHTIASKLAKEKKVL